MLTIKTSELTGAALDWAVAKCEGLPLKLDPMGFRKDAPTSIQAGWWVWDGEGQNQVIGHRKTSRYQEEGYSPSTDWAQGGPILQRHISELIDCGEYGWEACCNGTYGATGNTALEAVCKAYVASKLGDSVGVPEGLTC